MTRSLGRLFWAALAGGVLLAGCAGIHAPTTGAALSADPWSQEIQGDYSQEYLQSKGLGRTFFHEALHQYHFRTDYEVAAYVQRVGRKLVTAAGIDPTTYHFFVVENPQANAFSIPGGYIFVFDGLLSRLGSEEELAGVLGHEINHVRLGHFFKDQKKTAAADLAAIAAILLGQGREAVAAFSLAGTASLQLSFSRDNEREADLGGLDLLGKAGYNLNGMPSFFEKLMRQERLLSPGNEFPYLATHPGLDERYGRVKSVIARRDVSVPYRPTDDWDLLSATLRAGLGERGLIDQDAFHAGIIHQALARYPEALAELEQAERAWPDRVVVRLAAVECLIRMGQGQKAAPRLQEALRMAPDNVTARFLEGELARLDGRLDDARTAYETAIRLGPDHSQSFYRLSELIDKQGDHVLGGYYFARYLRLTLHPYEAYATYRRIQPQVTDPVLAKKIKAELQELLMEGV